MIRMSLKDLWKQVQSAGTVMAIVRLNDLDYTTSDYRVLYMGGNGARELGWMKKSGTFVKVMRGDELCLPDGTQIRVV